MVITEVNMENDEVNTEALAGPSTAPRTVPDFGPVANALLLAEGGGADDAAAMFVRITSWLAVAAASWLDSKVCVKAATILVKVIDFVSCKSALLEVF